MSESFIEPDSLNTIFQNLSAVVDDDGATKFLNSEISSFNFDGLIPLETDTIQVNELVPGMQFILIGDSTNIIRTALKVEFDDPEMIDSATDDYTISYLGPSGDVQTVTYSSTDEIEVYYEDWESKVLGTTGWTITQAGNAIFSNVAVRGRIEATEGLIDGDLIVTGSLSTSETADTTGGIIFSNTGILAYDEVGNNTFSLDATTGDVTIFGTPGDDLLTGEDVGDTGTTTISGSRITTGIIQSNNFVGTADGVDYSDSGMAISLLDGTITSEQFRIDSLGNAYFSGDLSAAGGTFTGTLSAADGTFTGTLSAADGTFTGTLSAADGTFTGTLSGVDGTFEGSLAAGISINSPIITGGTLQTATSGSRIRMSSGLTDRIQFIYNDADTSPAYMQVLSTDISIYRQLQIVGSTVSGWASPPSILLQSGIGTGASNAPGIFLNVPPSGRIVVAGADFSSGGISLLSGAYYGDGSGLNTLNASELDSGTVPSGRLSGTYSISISGNAATATIAGTATTASRATQANSLNSGAVGGAEITGQAVKVNNVGTSTSTDLLRRDGNNNLKVTSSSTRKIKTDIFPFKNYNVLNIDVVEFKYIDGYLDQNDQRVGQSIPGFIAEQVYEEIPIAVDLDENSDPKNWNERILIPIMVKTIQDQQKFIESLEDRISKLEEKNG